jgi:hypothetical protein
MRKTIALLPVLALMACASAKVSSEYDKATDFSRYQTYAWIKGMEAANPAVEQRIKSAVDQELAARGLKKVGEAAAADLEIASHASTNVAQEVNVESYGYGYAGSWSGNAVSVRNVDVGTLLLDVVDRSSQQLVWRGMATGIVGHTVPQEKVDKTVKKLLTGFPLGKG